MIEIRAKESFDFTLANTDPLYRIEGFIQHVHFKVNEMLMNRFGTDKDFKKTGAKTITGSVGKTLVISIEQIVRLTNAEFNQLLTEDEVKGVSAFMKHITLNPDNESLVAFIRYFTFRCLNTFNLTWWVNAIKYCNSSLHSDYSDYCNQNKQDCLAIMGLLVAKTDSVHETVVVNQAIDNSPSANTNIWANRTKKMTVICRAPNFLYKDYPIDVIDHITEAMVMFPLVPYNGHYPLVAEFVQENDISEDGEFKHFPYTKFENWRREKQTHIYNSIMDTLVEKSEKFEKVYFDNTRVPYGFQDAICRCFMFTSWVTAFKGLTAEGEINIGFGSCYISPYKRSQEALELAAYKVHKYLKLPKEAHELSKLKNISLKDIKKFLIKDQLECLIGVIDIKPNIATLELAEKAMVMVENGELPPSAHQVNDASEEANLEVLPDTEADAEVDALPSGISVKRDVEPTTVSFFDATKTTKAYS